ncbi:MAG: hypothetical protein AMJ81_11375 [Phycisphaerae bacterium SM23_33]|jgi:hypothetical protein|nr:MAG: hypothetical protein AMJ81_11375 [Phycisphaerae bacterium SM23_33]
MEIRQKKQVSELLFIVYNRALHPELFEIRHDHRIVKDKYESRIWVTGLSHVISFHRGEATLCEVIADTSAMLPRRGKLISLPFRGERDEELNHAEGIHYLTSFQVETLSPRLYAKVHGDLAAHAADHGLFVPFPEWAGGGPTPFTYLDYEAKLSQLHVFAYHAFPDEMTLIKTQSIFEVA